MSTPRKRLYERLPEIYRIRDGEQFPAGQLQAYVDLIDGVNAQVRDNIEQLYHDLFIETCADWVIPYIGDSLGTSALAGDPWTLRADVARTVNHRRRKGTLGAIESLTYALTGWAVHTVEMFERLAWNQHLNHQRPDAGGAPPLSLSTYLGDARRGGTVNLRNPALLSLVNGPFDPFAHVVDVKPASAGCGGYNLPNLAIFLWRLEAYTIARTRPVLIGGPVDLTPVPAGLARYAVRFELHPQSEPFTLFNMHRFRADDEPPNISTADAVPGPMPWPRLSSDTPAGRPQEYIEVALYASGAVPAEAGRVGLSLHVPNPPFTAATPWRFRGANLCAWEAGLHPPLRAYEIAVDPERGRLLFGVIGANVNSEATPLSTGLYVSPTYGFPGPVGAHPVTRAPRPSLWLEQIPLVRTVNRLTNPGFTLADALSNVQDLTQPLIVEIEDSLTHELDLNTVLGTSSEAGIRTLRPARSLWIRATSDQRPVVQLARPLAFRPHDVLSPAAAVNLATLTVKLEGLYITRATGFGATAPLIARAALNQLIVDGCTLDPGGVVGLNETRAPIREAFRLTNTYGFSNAAEAAAFNQIPEIVLQRSILGPLRIDDRYRVDITEGIVDGGSGVGAALPVLAFAAASGDPELQWGAPLTFAGLTCLGRVRCESAHGRGALFVHALQAHNDQIGCIKFSYFAASGNRLPAHHACVFGTDAQLAFVAETFGRPGYAQLDRESDVRIVEQGPDNDEMGAFGFLRNTHKWKNIHIRYREYMPVGVRPVLITVT